MKPSKPRSIKAKREQAERAWSAWESGEINGADRNALSAPFLSIAGLEVGQPRDVERVLLARADVRRAEYAARRAIAAAERNTTESKRLLRNAKRQKVERNQLRTYAKAEILAQKADAFLSKAVVKTNEAKSKEYTVDFTRNAIRQKEKRIADKLVNGELAIRRKSLQGADKLNESVQRYRDYTERTVRKAADSKEKKEAIRKQDNYRGDSNRLPGIPWKGGQLRAGTMTGETMHPLMAAAEFADKYFRSTLPNSDISPATSVRGMNGEGKIIEATVPTGIIDRMKAECKAGKQPDTSELEEWLNEWCDENEIDEIDLFADEAYKYPGTK